MFSQPIMPFREFVQSLQLAPASAYLNVPNSQIADQAAFDSMRDYLIDYYTGVDARHSFVDANGAVFDCIPIHQQVSLRTHRGPVADPPNLPTGLAMPGMPPSVGLPVMQLDRRFTDSFGNRMEAPEETIPVMRLTLETLARFPSLELFLTRPPADPTLQRRQWALAGQKVANVGGGSILNIWDPQVGPGQLNSLSQMWLSNAAGSQTLETGWQVTPNRYGSSKPVLFVYWTADGYKTTGTYNLTSAGFVQTSRHWMLGGAFPAWSASGGPQCEVALSWYLKDDRWWLFIGGRAVGYFPTSVFNGGDLAKGAAALRFGGEAVTTDEQSWPAMGSGAFPAGTGEGSPPYNWREVAYHRQLHYFPPAGGRTDVTLDALGGMAEWCYALTSDSFAHPWGTTIWFGGSNGTLCDGGRRPL